MATLTQKIAAERAVRDTLQENGLPQPDEVEYGHTCIRLFWEATRQCVIIQIDAPPPGWVHPEEMTAEELAELVADAGELEQFETPFHRFDFEVN
jgi:hypothetical protein